jgi:hypothetical protein
LTEESICRRWGTGGDANRGMLPLAWAAGAVVVTDLVREA